MSWLFILGFAFCPCFNITSFLGLCNFMSNVFYNMTEEIAVSNVLVVHNIWLNIVVSMLKLNLWINTNSASPKMLSLNLWTRTCKFWKYKCTLGTDCTFPCCFSLSVFHSLVQELLYMNQNFFYYGRMTQNGSFKMGEFWFLEETRIFLFYYDLIQSGCTPCPLHHICVGTGCMGTRRYLQVLRSRAHMILPTVTLYTLLCGGYTQVPLYLYACLTLHGQVNIVSCVILFIICWYKNSVWYFSTFDSFLSCLAC